MILMTRSRRAIYREGAVDALAVAADLLREANHLEAADEVQRMSGRVLESINPR